MILSLHQPQYLPWLGYFDKIDNSDVFVYIDDVQYKKREWQNRNRIKTPQGLQWLSVPVQYNDRSPINKVFIQNEFHWQKEHLLGIELNYKKAKYFNKYKDIFFCAIAKKRDLISELNIEINGIILELLGIEKRIVLSSSLGIQSMKTDRIIDICKAVGADIYLSGQGAKDYLEMEKFAANNIKLVFQEFNHPVYSQLFGGFLPYASVIDLIFNEGPNSMSIIRGANKGEVNVS